MLSKAKTKDKKMIRYSAKQGNGFFMHYFFYAKKPTIAVTRIPTEIIPIPIDPKTVTRIFAVLSSAI